MTLTDGQLNSFAEGEMAITLSGETVCIGDMASELLSLREQVKEQDKEVLDLASRIQGFDKALRLADDTIAGYTSAYNTFANNILGKDAQIKALIEAGEEMGVYIYSTTDGDKKAPACVVNWRKAKEGIK